MPVAAGDSAVEDGEAIIQQFLAGQQGAVEPGGCDSQRQSRARAPTEDAALACLGSPRTPKACHAETASTVCSTPDKESSEFTCLPAQREVRVCRFCLESEEAPFEAELDTPAGQCQDTFVAPCPCRGSAKYVHVKCLIQHFEASGRWHHFRCPTCQQPYEGRALMVLAKISRDRMASAHGAKSPQVAHSLCYLAQACSQLGSYGKAKQCLEEGLAIAVNHFGEGHVATAATLAELATAHGKMGDVHKQKELLERSLEIKERHFGVGHINTAVTLNNLAAASSEVGDIQQEKDLLQRSLAIKEKHFGRGHVQTTAALVNLAGVYGEVGELAKSLELLKWSLEIEERHYGEGHVETAITLNNLALAFGECGQLQSMHASLVRCLAIKEQHFGPDHPDLCLTLANFSMACAVLGQDAAAKASCQRALHISAALPSSRSRGVVMLRSAAVHASIGDEVSCAELGKGAVDMLDAILGASATARVLQRETKRIQQLWAAAGRDEVATTFARLVTWRTLGGAVQDQRRS